MQFSELPTGSGQLSIFEVEQMEFLAKT